VQTQQTGFYLSVWVTVCFGDADFASSFPKAVRGEPLPSESGSSPAVLIQL